MHRINARIDDSHHERLLALMARGDRSMSDVVRKAVDLLYEQEVMEKTDSFKALLESGLVGSLEGGEPNDSTNYKAIISEYLDEKFAHHR